MENVWGHEETRDLLEVSKKLDLSRVELVKWSRKVFPNNQKLLMDLKQRLETEPHNRSKLLTKINGIWAREEAYWQQKSRVKWLECGDRNTSFFHQITIQRRALNKIIRIKDESGNV